MSAAGVKRFDESFRPVRLERKVLAFQPAKSSFLFDRNLNYRLYDTVTAHNHGKPTLVFCSTRKETANAAQQVCVRVHVLSRDCIRFLIVLSQLAKDCVARIGRSAFVVSSAALNALNEAAKRVTDKSLQGERS